MFKSTVFTLLSLLLLTMLHPGANVVAAPSPDPEVYPRQFGEDCDWWPWYMPHPEDNQTKYLILKAWCPSKDNKKIESTIELNNCINNNRGDLAVQKGGGNFNGSCVGCTLEHPTSVMMCACEANKENWAIAPENWKITNITLYDALKYNEKDH